MNGTAQTILVVLGMAAALHIVINAWPEHRREVDARRARRAAARQPVPVPPAPVYLSQIPADADQLLSAYEDAMTAYSAHHYSRHSPDEAIHFRDSQALHANLRRLRDAVRARLSETENDAR